MSQHDGIPIYMSIANTVCPKYAGDGCNQLNINLFYVCTPEKWCYKEVASIDKSIYNGVMSGGIWRSDETLNDTQFT